MTPSDPHAAAHALDQVQLQIQEAFDLHKAGQLRQALAAYDRAIAAQPNFFEAHFGRGNVLEQMGDAASAVAAFDRAIAINPAPEVYGNRGNALQKIDQFDAAVASYDKALALQPALAHVLFSRGIALKHLGRFEECLADHAKALAIQPDYIEAKKNIFSLHLAALQDAPLIDRLGAELLGDVTRNKIDTLIAKKIIPDFCVAHDLEQTAYLIAQGIESEGLREANLRLAEIHARCAPRVDPGGTVQPVEISDVEAAAIARWLRQPLRYRPQVPEHCLNPDNDWAGIEDRYFADISQIVQIDDMLSPQALAELRRFCLVSTVWNSAYINQYLGAFAIDGFVSPLHVKIAQELRSRMPRIFGPHRLEHLWAFKYSQRMPRGINVHADFARVNLNFWITPDDANLDPAKGGMIVYDAQAPRSWSFDEYNNREQAIYEFLKQNNAGARRVPYKCNRAVLFNSNLFHETDALHFKPGYENRRINVTYLFGRGLKST